MPQPWHAVPMHALIVILCLLAACQVAERPDVLLRRDFPEVEINRIGDFHPSYADYQDIALLNALHHVLRAGMLKEALEQATVAPVHTPLLAPQGYPSYYELWLRIAGCESLIYMKANFNGRLFSVHDKGGCLKGAAAPKLTRD